METGEMAGINGDIWRHVQHAGLGVTWWWCLMGKILRRGFGGSLGGGVGRDQPREDPNGGFLPRERGRWVKTKPRGGGGVKKIG